MDLTKLIKGKQIKDLYFAECPFCNGTLVFNANEFACYSCGRSGDAADYLAEKNHVSRTQANWQLSKEDNTELLDVLKIATEYFINSRNDIYRKYISERNITPEVADRFQLGWADGKFLSYIANKGYDKISAQRVGLIKPKGYDAFHNRLMFPIMNRQGQVVGFSGRRVLQKDTGPKYLNSVESKVFQKKECLFGIQNINPREPVYIVEGQMDALSLQSKGINAVAVLGAAVGSGHAHLLRSLGARSIILALDGDEAGIKNALKGIQALKEFDLTVLCNYKDCKDPDEFINRYGAEAFRALPTTALNTFLLKSGVDLIDIL